MAVAVGEDSPDPERGGPEEESDQFAVVILAGGRSSRMGTDKSFLRLGEREFINSIAAEALKLSSDVTITIGRKSPHEFSAALDRRVKIVEDDVDIGSPLGGMLTGFNHVHAEYAAVIACDLPMVRSSVVERLFTAARGHDAAVPIWDAGDPMTTEPLCAVYRVGPAREVIQNSLREGNRACRRVVLALSDVNFVPVSELKSRDPELTSLRNINTREQYARLLDEWGKGLVPQMA